MALRKVGNIHQGSGLKKVGNIRTGFNRGDSYQNPQDRDNQYAQEAQKANSWQGMLGNTLKGVFEGKTYGRIGTQLANNPADTLKSIGSGVYKGAIEPLAKIQRYTNPSSIIPYLTGAQQKTDKLLDYQPKTETGRNIQSGFEFGGAVAPYEAVGTAIANIPRLAQAPRLAKYLGYVVPGQVFSDKKITDLKGRGEQLGMDSLLFGLTGGLRKLSGSVQSTTGKTALERQKALPQERVPEVQTSSPPSPKPQLPIQEGVSYRPKVAEKATISQESPLIQEARKGEKVFRGTLGKGEIDNILAGKSRYIEGETGGMWAKTPEEATNYAKGHSMATGMATRKPIGEGSYLLEGIKKSNGEIIPTKATEINTGKVIDLSQPLQEGGNIPPVEPPTTTNIPEAPQDPVQKVIQALKQAKPLRGQQEALYSQERSRRIAKAIAMGDKVPGEQGYFAQLGSLKGGLPKKNFEGIRTSLEQGDIDHLFNQVEGSKILTPFEKITAKGGLAKLLGNEGGQIPTKGEISLLSDVFPKEFVDSILEKRSLGARFMDKAGEVLSVPRSLMASFDLSAPLRQGIFLIGKPKQWAPAVKDMFKYAFSEKSYQGVLESIQSRPTYQLMRESGLSLTDLSKGLEGREERFMSNLAEKIPGIGKVIRGSDRAYTGFLNKLRADVFDDLVGKLGKDQAGDIARFVNSATGRGELPQVLSNSHAVLNGAFFSPRLMASRINLMNPQYYISLSPAVRKEALKSLLSFGGTVASVLGLAELSGAEIGTDPRSADFAKIKTGNTRYDILGGFQQYAVLAYRLATNEMVSSTTGKEFSLDEGYKAPGRLGIIGRFLSSKESPIVGFVSGMLSGQDSMGQEFKPTPEIINRFIPMLIQDLTDTMGEYGTGKGALMQAPGVFGVGTQTYTDQIPVLEKTPTGSPTVKFNPYPSIGEKIQNAITGTEVSQIPQDQWEGLRQERAAETQRRLEVEKIKQKVLSTGKSERIGDTFVYLQNGVVKTKKLGDQSRTPVKDRILYEEIQKRKTNPFYQP